MPPPRSIIHLNVADFAVAVERLVDRRFCGRPLIVAPQGGARSVVYDMSEEAFRGGVRKGMPLRQALRRCPEAAVIPPHPDRYERAKAAMAGKGLAYSPLVESGPGNGHLFIDATGGGRLFGPARDLAWRIRRQIQKDLGLDPIGSVASNKLVAKVASRVVKPSGECMVAAGDEQAFLRPLPVDLLPGLEKEELARLRELNLKRVIDMLALNPAQMEVLFDRRGRRVYELVRGIDSSPVAPADCVSPRVAVDHEFPEDVNDPAVWEAALYALAERAGAELRARGLAARRIGVILDYSDGMRRARQASAGPGVCTDRKLFESARRALHAAGARRVRVRHLRLVCDRLVSPPAQLFLFPGDREQMRRGESLQAVIDAVRNRFGTDAIRAGRTL